MQSDNNMDRSDQSTALFSDALSRNGPGNVLESMHVNSWIHMLSPFIIPLWLRLFGKKSKGFKKKLSLQSLMLANGMLIGIQPLANHLPTACHPAADQMLTFSSYYRSKLTFFKRGLACIDQLPSCKPVFKRYRQMVRLDHSWTIFQVAANCSRMFMGNMILILAV